MSLANSGSNEGNQDTSVSVSTIVNVDAQKVHPTSINDMLSYNLWLRNQYTTIPYAYFTALCQLMHLDSKAKVATGIIDASIANALQQLPSK
jgi:hypothetical protein